MSRLRGREMQDDELDLDGTEEDSDEERRASYVSARCTSEKKASYHALAERLGYPDFSKFMIAMLDSLERDFGQNEEYECHLLHVRDDTILAAEAHEVDGVPFATAAFRVVAPRRFWDHVRQATAVSSRSKD